MRKSTRTQTVTDEVPQFELKASSIFEEFFDKKIKQLETTKAFFRNIEVEPSLVLSSFRNLMKSSPHSVEMLEIMSTESVNKDSIQNLFADKCSVVINQYADKNALSSSFKVENISFSLYKVLIGKSEICRFDIFNKKVEHSAPLLLNQLIADIDEMAIQIDSLEKKVKELKKFVAEPRSKAKTFMDHILILFRKKQLINEAQKTIISYQQRAFSVKSKLEKRKQDIPNLNKTQVMIETQFGFIKNLFVEQGYDVIESGSTKDN